jgi:hypothetical protein
MIVSEPVKPVSTSAQNTSGSRDANGTFITGTDNVQKEQVRKKYVPLVKESSGGLINQFSAHKQAISSIQYIHNDNSPIILTSGADRKVRIHTIAGKKLGTLK